MRQEPQEIKYSCARCVYLIADQFAEFKCKLSNNTINKRLITQVTCENFRGA